MFEIGTLTAFLGWCCVINIGILFFWAIIVMMAKKQVSNIHSRLFGISQEKVIEMYFKYLASYKILILIFNIVPYIALKIIST